MRYKTIMKYLAVCLLATAPFGCGHYSPYTACRVHDFKDMMTMTTGCGVGLKVRAGPFHAGLLKNRDWAGLRGGEFFRERFDESGSEDGEMLAWGHEYFQEAYFRGKNYDFVVYDFPLMGNGGAPDESGLIPFVSLPKRVPWYYYTQCELVVGAGGSVRLGVNLGEVLDGFLGWFKADIGKDDYLSMPEYVSCRRITAEGVKWNAARIKGRNIEPYQRYKNYDPASAMGIAVARDRVDIAKALVETGDRAIIFPTASSSMAQTMIDMGADVNASVPGATGLYDRATPLINVALQGSAATVGILLKNGAKVNALDRRGRPALFYAVTRRANRETEALCCPEIVKSLLDGGANVDVVVPAWGYFKTRSILGCAVCGSGSPTIVQMLLAAGADPNSEDILGVAISSEASYCGRRDYSLVVKELIEGGARVRNNHLFQALNSNVRNVETVRVLLESGADANARGGTENKPPLIAAFTFSYSQEGPLGGPRPSSENIRRTLEPIVELLIDHGADPQFPGVMRQARKFLKKTALLDKMERLARE